MHFELKQLLKFDYDVWKMIFGNMLQLLDIAQLDIAIVNRELRRAYLKQLQLSRISLPNLTIFPHTVENLIQYAVARGFICRTLSFACDKPDQVFVASLEDCSELLSNINEIEVMVQEDTQMDTFVNSLSKCKNLRKLMWSVGPLNAFLDMVKFSPQLQQLHCYVNSEYYEFAIKLFDIERHDFTNMKQIILNVTFGGGLVECFDAFLNASSQLINLEVFTLRSYIWTDQYSSLDVNKPNDKYQQLEYYRTECEKLVSNNVCFPKLKKINVAFIHAYILSYIAPNIDDITIDNLMDVGDFHVDMCKNWKYQLINVSIDSVLSTPPLSVLDSTYFSCKTLQTLYVMLASDEFNPLWIPNLTKLTELTSLALCVPLSRRIHLHNVTWLRLHSVRLTGTIDEQTLVNILQCPSLEYVHLDQQMVKEDEPSVEFKLPKSFCAFNLKEVNLTGFSFMEANTLRQLLSMCQHLRVLRVKRFDIAIPTLIQTMKELMHAIKLQALEFSWSRAYNKADFLEFLHNSKTLRQVTVSFSAASNCSFDYCQEFVNLVDYGEHFPRHLSVTALLEEESWSMSRYRPEV